MIVLDAWAVLALLQDEPAAARVERAIEDGRAVMSVVNLGEVLYIAAARTTMTRAEAVVRALRSRLTLDDVDTSRALAAARLKATHSLSYADAHCVATAQRRGAPLWTGDPEILDLAGTVELVDLRSA